jgi:hypothetical protein
MKVNYYYLNDESEEKEFNKNSEINPRSDIQVLGSGKDAFIHCTLLEFNEDPKLVMVMTDTFHETFGCDGDEFIQEDFVTYLKFLKNDDDKVTLTVYHHDKSDTLQPNEEWEEPFYVYESMQHVHNEIEFDLPLYVKEYGQ